MAKFDPEVWTLGLRIGIRYIQRGINNFDDWSKTMTENATKHGIQKELIEPWLSAIWETLCNIPEGSKFNEEQILTLADRIGGLYAKGTTGLFGIVKAIEDDIGTENAQKLFPMIRANYAGIKRYFDDLERKPKLKPEKLFWKVEGKTLTVGGVRAIKFYSYGELPWVDSVDAIQNIVIEAGVETISAEAFSECKRLELLTIPASVKTIGDCAFTFCYCGNRAVNGGKNVIWSLDDGILTFKKNPAVRNATDFTIGAVSWRAVDKNITGVKIERDVIPDKKFFDWRNGLSRDVPVSM